RDEMSAGEDPDLVDCVRHACVGGQHRDRSLHQRADLVAFVLRSVNDGLGAEGGLYRRLFARGALGGWPALRVGIRSRHSRPPRVAVPLHVILRARCAILRNALERHTVHGAPAPAPDASESGAASHNDARRITFRGFHPPMGPPPRQERGDSWTIFRIFERVGPPHVPGLSVPWQTCSPWPWSTLTSPRHSSGF